MPRPGRKTLAANDAESTAPLPQQATIEEAIEDASRDYQAAIAETEQEAATPPVPPVPFPLVARVGVSDDGEPLAMLVETESGISRYEVGTNVIIFFEKVTGGESVALRLGVTAGEDADYAQEMNAIRTGETLSMLLYELEQLVARGKNVKPDILLSLIAEYEPSWNHRDEL